MGQLGGGFLLRGRLRARAPAEWHNPATSRRGVASSNPLCPGSWAEGVRYATPNGEKPTPAAGQRDGLPGDRLPWPPGLPEWPIRSGGPGPPGLFPRRRSSIKRGSERWDRSGGAMAAGKRRGSPGTARIGGGNAPPGRRIAQPEGPKNGRRNPQSAARPPAPHEGVYVTPCANQYRYQQARSLGRRPHSAQASGSSKSSSRSTSSRDSPTSAARNWSSQKLTWRVPQHRPSRRSSQTAEPRRPDGRARTPGPHLTLWVGPHPAHRRIPVDKASPADLAALAYDSALYRNRPPPDLGRRRSVGVRRPQPHQQAEIDPKQANTTKGHRQAGRSTRP